MTKALISFENKLQRLTYTSAFTKMTSHHRQTEIWSHQCNQSMWSLFTSSFITGHSSWTPVGWSQNSSWSTEISAHQMTATITKAQLFSAGRKKGVSQNLHCTLDTAQLFKVTGMRFKSREKNVLFKVTVMQILNYMLQPWVDGWMDGCGLAPKRKGELGKKKKWGKLFIRCCN